MDLLSDIELVTLSADNERFRIAFAPNQARQEKLRMCLPGVKHDRKNDSWSCPANADNAQMLKRLLGKFSWSDEALKLRTIVKEIEAQRIELSKAPTAELEVPGFGKPPRPFQKAGIAYALERQRVIIGDEMGLGKTIQALATIHLAQAYPCMVVAPASNIYTWAEEEIPACLPGVRVVLAQKDTPPLLLQMADIIVTNYEQLVGFRTYRSTDGKMKRTSWKDSTKKEIILSELAKHLLDVNLASVIIDEAHKLKNSDTANCHAARALKKDVQYRLLLTGTPVLNKPAEFASLLQYLDRIDEFGGVWNFKLRYCGLKEGRFGMESDGATHTLELNTKLRASCYIRRLKKDVLPELPPKSRGHVLVEIDNREEYTKAEDELIEWVKDRVRQNKEFLESIADLSLFEQELAIKVKQEEKAAAAERGEQMVRIQALKNVAGRGKLKAAINWINDFLESGEKLVVFATHREILDTLLKTYPKAARIIADDDKRERKQNSNKFQDDPGCNLLIGAMGTSAGNSPAGVGHNLQAASNVLFLELGWNPALHDQCEDRCHRIGQFDNVTCHYLLGRKTIDLDIAEIIEAKRQTCREVVDGLENEIESGILDQLVERLASRT